MTEPAATAERDRNDFAAGATISSKIVFQYMP